MDIEVLRRAPLFATIHRCFAPSMPSLIPDPAVKWPSRAETLAAKQTTGGHTWASGIPSFVNPR